MKRVSIWCIALATLTFACADNNRDNTATDDTAVGANTSAADRNAPDTGAGGTAGADLRDDRRFVEQRGAGGVAEVKLGQLAVERASNPEVKQFARRMVADHSKANEELKRLASQLDVQLPVQLDEKHQDLYDRLAKLKGQEFDREYMQAMVDGHQDVLNELERHTQGGRTGDRGVGTAGETTAQGRNAVSQWVTKTTPTVREHLDQARQIKDKLGNR